MIVSIGGRRQRGRLTSGGKAFRHSKIHQNFAKNHPAHIPIDSAKPRRIIRPHDFS
jgi:hypothetical protein